MVAGKTISILQDGSVSSACAFLVSPTQAAASPDGGNVLVTITKTSGGTCPWIAQSQSAFLSISGTAAGTGSGTVLLVAAANPGSARTGGVIVAGQLVTISQGAPPVACSLSVSPTHMSAASGGGTRSVAVTRNAGGVCPWTAQSQAQWLAITSGASGTDNGVVTFYVAANTSGAQRSGTLVVAGHTVAVTQSAPSTPCTFRVSPDVISWGVGAGGQIFYITPLTGESCAWTAVSSAPWLTVSRESGQIDPVGYSTNGFTIDTNTGPARTATITVGNAAATVTQSGAVPSTSAAILSFTSDPGDAIAHGQSQSWTLTGSQIEVSSNQPAGDLVLNSPFGVPLSSRFMLHLASPVGQPLAAGYYQFTERFRTSIAAGLDFSWGSSSCNTSSGRLLISEISWTPGGTLERLHARFEQHCSSFSAGLYGQIWFDASGSTTPPALPPFPAPTTSGNTLFTYQSDPGDIIGGGASGSFSLATATFVPRAASGEPEVTISITQAGGSNWYLVFRGPSGPQLVPGTYDPATDPANPGTPRLSIRGWGSCAGSTLTGKFTVIEAAYGSTEVLRFRATFEARCGGSTAAIRGEVSIVADPWR
jgi:hypothetical protein